MSKITFINVPGHDCEILTVYPPVGVMMMSACLKQDGHTVGFIDADIKRLDPEKVLRQLRVDEKPDLIGISLNVSQVKHSVRYIEAVQRDFPGIPVILGGPYVSGVGKDIFKDFPTVDYAVVNEGEEAICDFMEYLNGARAVDDVRNLVYKNEGEVCANPISRITDLEALPLPDYSLVADFIEMYQGPPPSMAAPSVAIMCTRGCPYKCTFCSSPITWNRKVTFRSTDSIIKEILYLRDLVGIKEVYFQDDTLNARPKWLFDLCDKIISHGLHQEIYFKCAMRVNRNLVSKEILEKLREANFWIALYGVENGNQEMLKSINKNITLEEIERAFKMTRKAGILTNAAFMLGNYGETKETVRDSLNLMKKIKPDYVGFSIAIPFPGSELYRIVKEKGLISLDDFTQYQFGDVILRTDELDKQDLLNYVQVASREYYKLKQSRSYRQLTKNNILIKLIGEGFYWPEMRERWVRRTMKQAALSLPLNGGNAESVKMRVQADYPDIGSRPVLMQLWVNGKKHSVSFENADWRELSFPVVAGSDPYLHLKWKVDRTWNPARHGQTHDDREVGVTVEKIWVD